MASSSEDKGIDSPQTLSLPTGIQSSRQEEVPLNDATNFQNSSSSTVIAPSTHSRKVTLTSENTLNRANEAEITSASQNDKGSTTDTTAATTTTAAATDSSAATTTTAAATTTTAAATDTTAAATTRVPYLPKVFLQQIVQEHLTQYIAINNEAAFMRNEEPNITKEQITNQAKAMANAANVTRTTLLRNFQVEHIASMTLQDIENFSQFHASKILEETPKSALLASGTSDIDKDGKPVDPTLAQKNYQITLQYRAFKRCCISVKDQYIAQKEKEAEKKRKQHSDNMNERYNAKRRKIAAIKAKKDETRTPEEVAELEEAEKKRKQQNDNLKRKRNAIATIKAKEDDARTPEEVAELEKAEKQRKQQNDNRKRKKRAERNKIATIKAKKDETRTPEEVAELEKAEKKRKQQNDNLKRKRNAIATIKAKEDDARTPEEVAELEKAEKQRKQQNDNLKRKKRADKENSYLDEEPITKIDIGEHDIVQGSGFNVMECTIGGMTEFRNSITNHLRDGKLSQDEIANTVVSEVYEKNGCFIQKKDDDALERFFKISQDRAVELTKTRVETVWRHEQFMLKSQLFSKRIEEEKPSLSDGSRPDPHQLKEQYLQSKENPNLREQAEEEISNHLFPGIVSLYTTSDYDSNSDKYYLSHLCPQKIDLMQQNGDNVVIIPYEDIDQHTSELWHCDHLPDKPLPHLIPAGSSIQYAWFNKNLFDCIHHGIANAIRRGYMTRNYRNTRNGSNSVFLYLTEASLVPGGDWVLPAQAFHVLQNFLLTQTEVHPDFVLEIKLGPTGLFDNTTEIFLVRIDGNACNIKIL